MKNLIVFLVILLALFGVVGIIGGWINFSKDDDKATIELDTREMREDVRDATDTTVDVGRDLLDGQDDSLETSKELAPVDSDDDSSVDGESHVPNGDDESERIVPKQPQIDPVERVPDADDRT